MIFDNLDEIKKTATPADWWTKYFLHPLSIRIVSLLKGTQITPNHLTLLGTAVVLLAFPFICWGNYCLMVVAAVLLQFSLILDCADGQLARLRKSDSVFGEWLDRSTDKIKDFTIIYSLTYRYSQTNPNAWMLGFSCFFILFFIDFLGFMNKLSPLLPAKEEALVDDKETDFIKRLKIFKHKINYNFFQIGEQYVAYTVFIILNRIDWLFYFIIAYGSLTIVWVICNTFRESGLLDK